MLLPRLLLPRLINNHAPERRNRAWAPLPGFDGDSRLQGSAGSVTLFFRPDYGILRSTGESELNGYYLTRQDL